MYVLLVNLVVLGETCTQTGGIEDGTGTEDAGLRNAGALAERVGEDINRVADEQASRMDSGFRMSMVETRPLRQ